MKVGVFAASKERDPNHEKTRTHTQKELKERKEGKAKKKTRLNMLFTPKLPVKAESLQCQECLEMQQILSNDGNVDHY